MPQITVDYSDRLADDFDRPGFATALHEAVVEIAAAKRRGEAAAFPSITAASASAWRGSGAFAAWHHRRVARCIGKQRGRDR